MKLLLTFKYDICNEHLKPLLIVGGQSQSQIWFWQWLKICNDQLFLHAIQSLIIWPSDTITSYVEKVSLNEK